MKKKKINALKKAICFASVTMCLALSFTALTSCSDKETSQEPTVAAEDLIKLEEMPTADDCSTKYNQKAVVLGNGTSEFNASILNRLTLSTKAISDDAKAFVFTQGYNMDFTADEMKLMMKAYLNNACFVLVEPNIGNVEQMETKATEAIKSLIDDGEDVSQAYSFLDKLESLKQLNIQDVYDDTEVLAFRKHDMYVVRDLDDMAEISDKSALATAEVDGKDVEGACATTDYEPTDYDRGEATDMLVTWMNEEGEADVEPVSRFTRASGDAKTGIENYMQGNRVVMLQQVGPSRALGKTLRYELVYTIYSAYDFETDMDYYFIRLRPDFHCSAFNCTTDPKKWVAAGKDVPLDDIVGAGRWWRDVEDRWYGTYMSAFNFTGEIVDESKNEAVRDAQLIAASPKTDITDGSNYTTGFDFSLAGSLGFNMSGPNGGSNAGVSFSESNSHSHPSLQMTHTEEGAVTKWNISGIVPKAHNAMVKEYGVTYLDCISWIRVVHDLVADFQINDWQTEFTWIVSVPYPAQQNLPFYLKATDFTEITDLNFSTYDYELRVHPTQTHYIMLNEPNRDREGFFITCSDESLQNVLEEQYSETWNTHFTFYGRDADEVENGAKTVFYGMEKILKGISKELVAKGFTGKYLFYLKDIQGEELGWFTMNNGKVV